MQKLKKYHLTIRPAIKPGERQRIVNTLKQLGYEIMGVGTETDDSECDIFFVKIDVMVNDRYEGENK